MSHAKPVPEPRQGGPLLAGLITGILLALLWLGVVYLLHDGVGLAAWGVGALIGLAVAKAARPPTRSTGILAALLTVGTVVLAKVLVLLIALRPIVVDELLAQPGVVTAMYMTDMVTHRSFSPGLQATLDSLKQAEHDTPSRSPDVWEVSTRMMDEARARAKAAPRAERERMVRASTDYALATQSFGSLLGRLFSWWDFLWLAFGVSTAAKLGQGIG